MESPGIKVMRLRYAGTCQCGTPVAAGTEAGWDATNRRVVCMPCMTPDDSLPTLNERAAADAGASLRNEYDRRMARREARVKGALPRIGGLLLAIFDEAPSTKAFKRGAEGERTAIKRLLENAGPDVRFLVNRRLGHGRKDGDIDVLAITRAGVHIIDVKRYANAAIRVERRGGLFSARTEHLMVRGRDRTNLLDSVQRQHEAVRAAIETHARFAATPSMSILCFVDANLPLFETPSIQGVSVLGPRQTSRQLAADGTALTPAEVEALATLLDAALPPAA